MTAYHTLNFHVYKNFIDRDGIGWDLFQEVSHGGEVTLRKVGSTHLDGSEGYLHLKKYCEDRFGVSPIRNFSGAKVLEVWEIQNNTALKYSDVKFDLNIHEDYLEIRDVDGSYIRKFYLSLMEGVLVGISSHDDLEYHEMFFSVDDMGWHLDPKFDY